MNGKLVSDLKTKLVKGWRVCQQNSHLLTCTIQILLFVREKHPELNYQQVVKRGLRLQQFTISLCRWLCWQLLQVCMCVYSFSYLHTRTYLLIFIVKYSYTPKKRYILIALSCVCSVFFIVLDTANLKQTRAIDRNPVSKKCCQ